MEDFKFFDCSPQSAEAEKIEKFSKKGKYPWEQCPIGKSFVVQKGSVSVQSLKIQANRATKVFKKKFVVVEHESTIEIACYPLKLDDVAPFDSNVAPVATGVVQSVNPPVYHQQTQQQPQNGWGQAPVQEQETNVHPAPWNLDDEKFNEYIQNRNSEPE